MSLPKAIEILSININERNHRMPIDVLCALKLSVEADKAVIESRRLWGERGVPKLPGENTD